jgi:hypothetical protein
MTKEAINLMLINGLKTKGHNMGNISPELLNDVATIVQHQFTVNSVDEKTKTIHKLLDYCYNNCSPEDLQFLNELRDDLV